jgi:RNA polymerase sigma factor (sigma-70 family)
MARPRAGQWSEPLLSAEEVTSLARQIEAGVLARAARLDGTGFGDATALELELIEVRGEQARQRFIQANLGLVGMVARQAATRSNLAAGDLFQEGCIGLITAVERYDPQRGHRFSTYALFWIRAYISAATARQLGGNNLPTSRAAQLRAARGVEADLVQRLGRSATVGEVAEALGRTEIWTAGLLAHQQPTSLELLDGETLEQLSADDGLDSVLGSPLGLDDLLGQLEPLERQVLQLRLGLLDGEPRSFAHTARALGVSVTRARRAEARALETLRGICPQQASVHL